MLPEWWPWAKWGLRAFAVVGAIGWALAAYVYLRDVARGGSATELLPGLLSLAIAGAVLWAAWSVR